uniref:Uncharacterized protein n=1 Tax=Arundo donax TaxID=35708 RepID=A0A0A9AN47_ARUDO
MFYLSIFVMDAQNALHVIASFSSRFIEHENTSYGFQVAQRHKLMNSSFEQS